MIFVGDIAVPNGVSPALSAMPWGHEATVVANLEGAFAPDDAAIETSLFNAAATVELAQHCAIRAFSLANNHITDLGHDLMPTLAWLERNALGGFGAGNDGPAAARPLLLEDGARRIGLLGFGWPVIGCRPVNRGRGGVNPLDLSHVLTGIARFREQHAALPLVLFMHWDYELELYPQPMHRQLAQAAIDAGANAVVGCHSHCIQGIEYHRGAPIVYGLGNWFLAEGVFKRGKLRFPAFARRQLAFEWRGGSGEDICHFFQYEPEAQRLHYLESAAVLEAPGIAELSPFRGMDHRAYVNWFKAHRRKRKLLPVYSDIDATVRNRCYDRLVGWRQKLIEAAVAARLKGGPR